MAPTQEPFDRADRTLSQPSPAECRQQMERILANPTLQASARRRALFRYLVEEALAGRGAGLKGYSIALAVFGRDDNFDPQSDPVVRLEARRLRRDLDGYYAGPGGRDGLRISIPKGGYVPHFEWADEGATLRVAPAAAAGGWLWIRDCGKAAQAAARGPAVMVLPFEALSTSEDDRFLAAGLTQELITNLMRFDGFRLYALPASLQQDDPVALGRGLGASYVVTGNLRSAAGIVRVGVQLVDAQSAQILRSDTYDLPMTPNALFDVQDKLATRISTLLGQPYGIVNSDGANRLLKN
jgi:TolB-like protein